MNTVETIDPEAQVLAIIEAFETMAACVDCGRLSISAMRGGLCPYCKNKSDGSKEE